MAVPINRITDDPAPLINVFWWLAAESPKTNALNQRSSGSVVRDIPSKGKNDHD